MATWARGPRTESASLLSFDEMNEPNPLDQVAGKRLRRGVKRSLAQCEEPGLVETFVPPEGIAAKASFPTLK
jgi:hypothetical protein